MPRAIKPLSATEVSNAKPNPEKQKTLFDGNGLFLLISQRGGKWWRFKYQFAGKANIISLGTYPEVSLADAREKREAARKLVAAGVDPSKARKAQKAAIVATDENSFEVIAREWLEKFSPTWSSSHTKTTLGRLELDVFPALGARLMVEVEAPEVLAMLRRIESRGALETAHRVRTICGQVFRYAIATGRARRDWAADLKGALAPYKKGNHAAIIDPKEVGPLLRAIDGYKGSFVVKSALQILPLVFVRSGELRYAEWSEFNLEAALWNIPAERMKGKIGHKVPHLVPLSTQAVNILTELKTLTGSCKYVFHGGRSKNRPMSENAINCALRSMGFDKDTMTGHGFRAMARTILDEVLDFRPDVIEHQLAHAVKDPLGRAYNRTTHLEERKKMMQLWATYLDDLKSES